MGLKEKYFREKYQRIEIIFFIIYFLFFPVFSGLEYYLFEITPPDTSIWKDTLEHLIFGMAFIILPWFCYKIIIQRFLFEKRYLLFFVILVAYFVFRSFYKLGVYWIVSRLEFLPDYIVSHATMWYKNNVFYHFFSIYEFRDLIVLTALAYFIRSAKQDKQISELKQQQLELELNYLKVQIQPHFFFNTLNNIYALTAQKSDKAAPLIAKHAEIMRYILYETSKKQVGLKQEINFLKNYVDVESMHYSEKMDISFETQGVNDLALIEPMLLLPFVENAFKHGIREEVDKGYVHIIVSLVENELFAEIKNSKPQNITEKKVDGIGMLNASKRLQMLYPDKYRIDIQNEAHTYELCLSLILKLHGQLHHS